MCIYLTRHKSNISSIFFKSKYLTDHKMLSEEDRKDLDVPFFEFKRILSATDNFSLANKLGQGGFGPVYKVMTLYNIQYIPY